MNRTLTECLRIDHGAQRTPDEPLDLLRPPRLMAAHRLTCRTLRPRAWEHGVLRRHPARARPLQKERHALLHRRRTDDARMTGLNERRAVRIALIAAFDPNRAQLIGTPQISSWHETISPLLR